MKVAICVTTRVIHNPNEKEKDVKCFIIGEGLRIRKRKEDSTEFQSSRFPTNGEGDGSEIRQRKQME